MGADVRSDRVARRLWPAVLVVLCSVVGTPELATPLDCGPETFIAGDDEYNDKGPALDVDPSGTAWLVWTGYDPVDGDEEIYYCTNDGSGWTAQDTLHGHNSSADRYPEISIGSDGVAWVVWYRAQANGERLWYSRHENGAWATPAILRTGADRYDDYDICAATSSDVWVATDGCVDDASGIGILVYHWNGSEWAEVWRHGFDTPGYSCVAPDVALDSSGAPWVTFALSQDAGYHVPIMYTHLTATGWAEADTVNGDMNNGESSQIVFDGDVPMVMWTGNNAATIEIEYSRFEQGEWTAPELVNLPDSTIADYDYVGECVTGPGGEIFATWTAGNHHDYFDRGVYVSQWTGSGWTPEQIVGGASDIATAAYSCAGVDQDGNLWSAWVTYEEIAPPWDEDIRGTVCSPVMTPVDFGSLNAHLNGDVVSLSWFAAGEAASGPFHVWRASAGAADGLPGEPPDAAERLTDASLTAPPYEWEDASPPSGVEVLYWIEWVRPGSCVYAGPASVATSGTDSSVSARLLFVSPNPSRSGARIGYEQSVDGAVSAVIYSVAGRFVSMVSSPSRAPGSYTSMNDALCWGGTDSTGNHVASGVYLVELRLDGVPVEGQRRQVTIVR